MSRPGESANPPVQPNVYLPYAETDPPPYEAYRDPAAAHGWENAYDETSELPRVAETSGPQGRDPQVFDPQVFDPQPSGGRADRRRAARRPRRALAAVGAVGVVSVAALVAGFAFSGSPDDAEQGRPAGTRSAPEGTAGAGDEGSASPTRVTDTGPTAGASPTVARPTASSGAKASEPPPPTAASPSAGPATSSAPAEAGTAPTADSGRGNAKGRGKGQR